MSRLVVVSNRVSPIREGEAGTAGGLAVAVLEALRDQGGVWFGWSGFRTESEPGPPSVAEVNNITQVLVDLPERDYQEYYRGYANSCLWPLLHYRPGLSEYRRSDYEGYRRVNRLFASRLLPRLQPDDVIWVHDYHLIPLAWELRQAGVANKIGFFLHTPFAAPEVLTICPDHSFLMEALCHFDLVGFQTETDLRAFYDYIRFESRGVVFADGRVEAFGRRCAAAVFPIGIDAEGFATLAEKAKGMKSVKTQFNSLDGRRHIVGVDRLDYSKGLLHRFEAFERLLQDYPDVRNGVVFTQIAPPSREDVPEYMTIRAELEQAAGRINGLYAELDWSPLRYINRSFSRRMLSGVFRTSHVALVTPLRDGMNLVAKEYVAAQDPEDPGVLVLSRFAGAARQLTGSIIVNPMDIDGVAEAIQKGLSMSLDERKELWAENIQAVRARDISHWCASFLHTLSALR